MKFKTWMLLPITFFSMFPLSLIVGDVLAGELAGLAFTIIAIGLFIKWLVKKDKPKIEDKSALG